LQILALLVLLVFLVVAGAQAQAVRRPNFVIVIADDLGYGDIGVYGNPAIQTPNLDKMSAEGVRLTSFYSTPTCTPSRAALLTGRYPVRSGLIRVLHPGERFGIPESEVTLAEGLKELGYATACIGKWHLGGLPRYRPTRHGFDEFYGLLWSNDMTLKPPDLHRLRLWRDDKAIEWPVVQSTLTRRYTEQAIDFIRRNREKPFFLYLPHTMPHVPLAVSEEFRGTSKRGIYGDVVRELDWSVGELLRTIRELGIDRETVVVFTSDNGPAVSRGERGGSAGPFRGGKQTTWEGGVRVPLIARWPGQIPGGVTRDGIASLMDLLPTVIAAAGGTPPDDRPIDGKNILPMLAGETGSPHSGYLHYSGKTICAARSGDWKLHVFRRERNFAGLGKVVKVSPPELYDLAADPSERHNVAESHPEEVERLSEMIRKAQTSIESGKLPPPVWRRWP